MTSMPRTRLRRVTAPGRAAMSAVLDIRENHSPPRFPGPRHEHAFTSPQEGEKSRAEKPKLLAPRAAERGGAPRPCASRLALRASPSRAGPPSRDLGEPAARCLPPSGRPLARRTQRHDAPGFSPRLRRRPAVGPLPVRIPAARDRVVAPGRASVECARPGGPRGVREHRRPASMGTACPLAGWRVPVARASGSLGRSNPGCPQAGETGAPRLQTWRWDTYGTASAP